MKLRTLSLESLYHQMTKKKDTLVKLPGYFIPNLSRLARYHALRGNEVKQALLIFAEFLKSATNQAPRFWLTSQRFHAR
jgi:hypothetical protein